MNGSNGPKAKLARIQLVSRVRVAYRDVIDALHNHDRAAQSEAQTRLRVLNRALAWMTLETA